MNATKTANHKTNGHADGDTHLAGLESAAKAAPAAKVATIALPKLEIQTLAIKLVGDSPLICHQWSEKAKKQMLSKQMMEASAGKTAKDPEQDYQDSLYHHPDGGYGFPAIAFKNAAVSACTSLGKSVTKVAARQSFHVIGEMAKVEGTPRMREDMVRVGMGTADIRYRGEFPEWSTTISVRFNNVGFLKFLRMCRSCSSSACGGCGTTLFKAFSISPQVPFAGKTEVPDKRTKKFLIRSSVPRNR